MSARTWQALSKPFHELRYLPESGIGRIGSPGPRVQIQPANRKTAGGTESTLLARLGLLVISAQSFREKDEGAFRSISSLLIRAVRFQASKQAVFGSPWLASRQYDLFFSSQAQGRSAGAGLRSPVLLSSGRYTRLVHAYSSFLGGMVSLRGNPGTRCTPVAMLTSRREATTGNFYCRSRVPPAAEKADVPLTEGEPRSTAGRSLPQAPQRQTGRERGHTRSSSGDPGQHEERGGPRAARVPDRCCQSFIRRSWAPSTKAGPSACAGNHARAKYQETCCCVGGLGGPPRLPEVPREWSLTLGLHCLECSDHSGFFSPGPPCPTPVAQSLVGELGPPASAHLNLKWSVLSYHRR
ncbi:hypothetical protein GGR56DRAFT_266827 [Xylariaceae sp. FL0804]|nr:hypothetical protein GGR56DRAFT_266827 [Xylariaceae sp. FL0804]